MIIGAHLKFFHCVAWIFCTCSLTSCGGGSAFTANVTGGTSSASTGGTSSGGDQGDSGLITGGDTGLGGATTSGGGTGYDTLSCTDLQTAYSTELTDAESCSTSGEDTCVQTVLNALACGCLVYVNSGRTVALTNLERIRTAWTNKKCASVACPAIACVVPTAATCVGTSGTAKTGVCTASAN